MEIYTKGEGINHSYVFFESDLSRVLKPMIWVYTKFEQNGKEKTYARLYTSNMFNA